MREKLSANTANDVFLGCGLIKFCHAHAYFSPKESNPKYLELFCYMGHHPSWVLHFKHKLIHEMDDVVFTITSNTVHTYGKLIYQVHNKQWLSLTHPWINKTIWLIYCNNFHAQINPWKYILLPFNFNYKVATVFAHAITVHLPWHAQIGIYVIWMRTKWHFHCTLITCEKLSTA